MRFIIAGFIVAIIFACTPKQEELASKVKTGTEADGARVETVVSKDTTKVDSIKVDTTKEKEKR